LAIAPNAQISSGLVRAARQGSVSTTELQGLHKRIEELVAARDAKVTDLEEEIKRLEQTLPPSVVAASRAVENAKKFRDEFDNYAKVSETVRTVLLKLEKLQRWRTFIAKAAGIELEDFFRRDPRRAEQ